MTNKGKEKGKEVAGKGSTGKRKSSFDDDKTGGGRKKNNRGVLQFFEDAADAEESDFSDFSDDDSDFDFSDDDLNAAPRRMDMPDKGQSSLPGVVPKEEVMDEEEWERVLEERYKDPSRFIRFADEFGDAKGTDPSSIHGGVDELMPNIWKVKCTVGRERLSALCLMQKFADLDSLGTKLKIKSAFAVDHMKGFVYIEAEKQYDINEACQGIPGIYATRVTPVPNSEVYHLFSVRCRTPEISEGMWTRIKGGNYKGDLAQVVSVNNTRKKVTVKLIPRIDLQALAAKFGGGYSRQKMAVPAPRLISSSELEEFRPLIQIKRDRDTGKVFEVLDGLMLKDGYVYKKVSLDSLSLWGIVPTQDELLKFGPSENNETNDLEWLSQLYGDKKKKRVIRPDKGGGGKGESSSGSGVGNDFELYDLVCFGKKDFGVIVGKDKDDIYKILKEGSDGPVAVTIERHEIKSGLFDLKLTALDHHSKTILVNDTVRVLEGSSKGKQGIVKHIYRGIVFLYDGNVEENGGYLTCKSNMCEKVKLAVSDCSGKDSEPGPLVFEDQPSSPRSPLSPKKPWQSRENNREFNRGDNHNMFTIGQSLRIRIGPLKGYLCRVIALRRADVTVKLDSQQKVLTVKCEHLSEVQGKSTAISSSADPDSSSSKPFDLLGTEGSSGGWLNGVGTSTGGGGWNAGGASSTGGGGWDAGGASSTGGGDGGWNAGRASSTEGGGWNSGGASSTGGGGWNAGGASSTVGGGWNARGASSTVGGGWNAGGASSERDARSNHSAPGLLNTESTSNPFSSKGAEDSAWETKNNSNQNSSWGAALEKTGIASTPNQSGGWGSGGRSCGQAEHKTGSAVDGNPNSSWNNKPNNLNGNQSSGGASKSNWNTTKASEGESSGWNSVQKSNETSSTGWGGGKGFKCGSDEGNLNSTWGGLKSGSSGVKEVGNPAGTSDIEANQDDGWRNKPNKDGSESSGWGTKNNWNAPVSSSHDKEKKDNDQGGWNAAKASGSLAAEFTQSSGWKGGLSENAQEGPNCSKKFGSSTVSENNGSDWGKASNRNSASGDSGGNQGNGWGQKSNWNSGSGRTEPGNQDSSNMDKKTNWNSGNSGNLASDPKSSNWNSGSGNSNEKSNWGNNGNNKSSWGAGNENKNSNWSSGHSDPGNQDSNQGKKGNWNSGNSGNQASDPNNSNWNSGSGDSNQNSKLGNNSNWTSSKSSWSAGNENKSSNWSSGDPDPGNNNSNWGKKSNWNSGSGDANENTTWRSNSSWNTGNASSNDGVNENSDGGGGNGRGGYQGRGGSDRGGFRGGRGFRGRGERGGFGGRGERGGFSGRGRSDREGFGGRWGSDGGRGGRGRGRFDQSGGWNNRRDSSEDGPTDWKMGADNGGWKNGNGSQAWNQDTGDKDWKSWSQGNADKERPSWNQGSGSNQSWSSASRANDNGSKAWNQAGNKQSWSSASGGANDNGNSNGSRPTAEASWKKSTTTEETNIQDSGWNKGSSSNTTSRDWAADKGKGQASSWKESTADGAAGSWGKKSDGGDKGGW